MNATAKRLSSLARAALILTVLGGEHTLGVNGGPQSERQSGMNIPPNAQVALPPLRADTFSIVEDWLRSCGWPWRKQELALGNRRIVCVDLAPYSGQPGRHLFVYQLLGERASLLFCSIVHNPPKQGAELSFRWKQDAESLIVTTGNAECFTIRLSTLWCD